MKINKKYILIVLLAAMALTLGACTGRRVNATGWSGITAVEDTVYFSYGPHAYALNLANGAMKWQFPKEPVNGEDYYAAPVFADEGQQLIVAGYNSNVYSLDPINGLENWSFTGADNRIINAPLATKTGIFVASSDNSIYALDFDGLLSWKFTSDEPLWASPVWSENCNCIYQTSMDRFLYALDPENGKLLWKSEDLGGPIVSRPTVSESGLIILSTLTNEVIAINEESHKIVWRYLTSDWAWATPVIDGEQVYVSDISGTFYALELESGNIIWQIQPGGGIFSAALVKDDGIYFSTDASSLVVVNRDGVIQRNTPVDGKLYASPATGDGKLLLAPSEAEFFLVAQNENGVQVWGFPPPN